MELISSCGGVRRATQKKTGPQFKDRTKLDGLFGREAEGWCPSTLTVTLQAGPPSCQVLYRKTGAQEFHPWASGSLRGSRHSMIKARLPLLTPRPPHALCPRPTPHACLTKKRGVKCVRAIHHVLLQEAGVGEAAFDHAAPLARGIQHGAAL